MVDIGPLSYQPANIPPPGLLIETLPGGGVRVALSAPPPRSALWREALAPAAAILICAVVILMGIYWMRAGPGGRPTPWTFALAPVGLVGLAFVAMDAWQNGGVVTEIIVEGDWLVWSKLNLWGPRTYQWAASRITGVRPNLLGAMNRGAATVASLWVSRRGGHGLNAFSKQRLDELETAAFALRQALRLRD